MVLWEHKEGVTLEQAAWETHNLACIKKSHEHITNDDIYFRYELFIWFWCLRVLLDKDLQNE